MAGGLDLALWEKFRADPPTEEDERFMAALPLVDYEIFLNKLVHVALEGKTVMAQTGSSLPLVAEDMSAGIYAANGDMAVAAAGVYFHSVTGQLPIKYAIKHWTSEPTVGIADGDVFYSTDAVYGGTHPADQICFVPIFHEGVLVAWSSAVAHQSDNGAITPGVPGSAASVYEVGMRLPPLKIGEQFALREDLMNAFGEMTRVPHQLKIDIRARVATCMRIRERVIEFCDEHGREALQGTLRRSIVQSGAEIRRKLRRYNDGTYRAATFFDDTGTDVGLSRLEIELVKKGDSVMARLFASPQLPGAFNAFKPLSMAAIANPLFNYLMSDIPASIGVLDAFEFDVEEGTMLNAAPEAATAAALAPIFCLEQLFHICFAKMAFDSPDRQHVAAPQDPFILGGFYVGVDEWDRPYAELDTTNNGCGGGGRTDKDGVDVFAPPWALYADTLDAERLEAKGQLAHLYRRFSRDTHGFGKHRGGASPDEGHFVHDPVRDDPQVVGSTLGSGSKFSQPSGLFGGYGGSCFPGIVVRNTNVYEVLAENPQAAPTSTRELMSGGAVTGDVELTKAARDMFPMKAGDIVARSAGGGGGYGDVLEREPDAVAHDVEKGVLSPERARAIYGVSLEQTPEWRVVVDETEQLRAQLREERREQSTSYSDFIAGWEQRRPPAEALLHYGPWPR